MADPAGLLDGAEAIGLPVGQEDGDCKGLRIDGLHGYASPEKSRSKGLNEQHLAAAPFFGAWQALPR